MYEHVQGGGGLLQAKERLCKKPALLGYLDLALPAPRSMRKTFFFLFKPPSLWYFVLATLVSKHSPVY